MVKTIPPLKTKRPSLGVAPFQKVNKPSSLKIFTKQLMVDEYTLSAPRACILVLTVSIGMVVYTVIVPAKAPTAKVAVDDKGSLGLVFVACCTKVLIELYAPNRTAELDACLKDTGNTPAYNPRKPKSRTNLTVPETRPFWYFGLVLCLSSIRAVLMASEGVTATTDSRRPAPKPANTPSGPDNFPLRSAKRFLKDSNPKKRTDALAVLPTTNAGQPTYNAEMPCVLATLKMSTSGFSEPPAVLSWSRVLANSNGYVNTPSTAPAVPPAINDLRGSALC